MHHIFTVSLGLAVWLLEDRFFLIPLIPLYWLATLLVLSAFVMELPVWSNEWEEMCHD